MSNDYAQGWSLRVKKRCLPREMIAKAITRRGYYHPRGKLSASPFNTQGKSEVDSFQPTFSNLFDTCLGMS